jgi:ankyrin repeat protein
MTPLHYAATARLPDAEVVKLLFSTGADPAAVSGSPDTTFAVALRFGNRDAARVLMHSAGRTTRSWSGQAKGLRLCLLP